MPGGEVVRSGLRRRQLAGSALRVGLSTIVLFGLYSVAPLKERPDPRIVVELVISLVILIAIVAWEIRAIVRSTYPGLQAVEAVAISVPLLILVFSTVYIELTRTDSTSFTQPLGRVAAVYFTVTVLATVGFGDISPVTDMARLVVTSQMVADLILVGFIAKVLFGAVQLRRQTLAEQPGPEQPQQTPRLGGLHPRQPAPDERPPTSARARLSSRPDDAPSDRGRDSDRS
ncbi:MAG TPA: ion channel [Frankiaceae bacterium]|nr:ion channel [Frankiaceae bacterium]